MDTNILVSSSIFALIIRLVALVIFITVVKRQTQQFKTQSEVQPLKKLLIAFVVMLIASQIPILGLHVIRIAEVSGGATYTAVATVTNSIGLLIAAIILNMIYRFK